MRFIRKDTKSGVPLYIFPMAEANSVASGVMVNVGSRDERLPHEAGLAHSFEHLFFQGTKKFPDQRSLAEYIEDVGGFKNGFTSKERTFFLNQVPFREFERGVDFLSEQIQHPLIPEDKIKKEVNVILQEIKRKQDNPSGALYDLAYEAIFKGHPLAHPTLGNERSLLALQREDFIDFMKQYYNSANFTFFTAGRIDPDAAVRMFDSYFTAPISGERNKRGKDETLYFPLEKEYIFHRPLNQMHMYVAVPILNASIKEKWCLDLFATMLGRGMASPLFQEIRDRRGLCYSASASYHWLTDLGLFVIYMATSKEKYKEAIDTALPLIDANKRNEALLEKAKRMELGSLALRFENPWNIIMGASSSTVTLGKPYGYEEVQAAIQDITIQDIEKAVGVYLAPERFTRVLLGPEHK
ncbi:insulinase family protein [Patescibacteria group bacterium]|nr:insulinase family protein [Patescibacteria group bacterium]